MSRVLWPAYRTIWRWHFYAGLFCIPFVIWLSATGAIYLFKPQIEAWIDAPTHHLQISGARAGADAQAAAALAALPGAVLSAYELPRSPQSAAQVLLKRDGDTWRAYVHPQSLQVLKLVRDEDRLMRVIFRLHGELMAGDRGSYVVELAASWAIVMIVSGLVLWWPRESGLAGVLWPRLGGGRRLLRDLHAVIGFWVSAFALFLLVSGLPWTQFWGGNLKLLREVGSATVIQQDWSTGSARPAPSPGAGSEHEHHHARMAPPPVMAPGAFDRVVARVAALGLAAPVIVVPPATPGGSWAARSDAQNRPLRSNLLIDGDTGEILQRKDFSQRPLLDRVIGVGVAAHEGQLFGWVNQALGVFTALGLIVLGVSALLMWWKRRPTGSLGAPLPVLPTGRPRFGAVFTGVIALFGLLLPMLGVSLLLVLITERLLLRRLPAARGFLGLSA